MKKVTLPRLELLAAEMSSKMAQYVQKSLQLPDVEEFLWTDSQIALCWIKAPSKQWKTFVSNRVQHIQQMSDPINWRWCPGVTNPADLVSRGIRLKELITSELWLHGPSWLQESREEYPKEVPESEQSIDYLAEQREKRAVCLVQKSQKPDAKCLAGKLVQPSKYWRLKTLLKTTAYITRYIYNISHKAGSRKSESLNTADIEASEKYWIQQVQEENFSRRVSTIEERRGSSK